MTTNFLVGKRALSIFYKIGRFFVFGLIFIIASQNFVVSAHAIQSQNRPGTIGTDARTLQIVTIVYNPNGGTGAPVSKRLYKDSHGTAWFTIDNRTPTKEGYEFIGWRLSGKISDDLSTPGTRIGLNTGRDGDETFEYLAAWKCQETHVELKGLNVADLTRAGQSYRQVQTALENEVVRIVNQVRADYGLQPLTFNRDLHGVARHRAQESTDYGYITGHISHATGLAHTDHALAKGLDVTFAGENWGRSQRTPQDIVDSWMQSPGHRDFILSGHETSRFSDTVYIAAGVAFNANNNFVSDKNWTLWLSR